MTNFFTDRTSDFDPADIEKNRVFGGLSYLWLLFILPLFACPQSRFAKFHANQGLVLFIIEAVINLIFGVVIKFVKIVPILGGVAAVFKHVKVMKGKKARELLPTQGD